MAVDSPFKISYGTQNFGGTSNTYQIHGPQVIDKSFETLRLVFDVVVVSTSYAALQNAVDILETNMRKRDQTLKIDLNALADPGGQSIFTYTFGTDILNTVATLTKSGDSESDRGFSRAYTCIIEGELPADDADPVTGLRDIVWNVDFEAGRQRIVSCEGVYTATTTRKASANYLISTGADAEATTFLAALTGSATYELVEESFTPDRNDHLCRFSRQYVELLVNQTISSLDSSKVRDHRMTFTEIAQHPGDSKQGIYRLRRVVGSYDAAIDIGVGTDLQNVYTVEIRDHVLDFFDTNFNPQVFTIEDVRIAYDESTKRISVAIQIVYQSSSGGDIVEHTASLAFREQRQIDYTPVHGTNELAFYVDVGWIILERVASRTVTVVGDEIPQRRLGVSTEPGKNKKGKKKKDGPAGQIEGLEGKPHVVRAGWNLISNTSQVTERWVGDVLDNAAEQIKLTVLTETVVERFNLLPKRQAITVVGTTPVKGGFIK